MYTPRKDAAPTAGNVRMAREDAPNRGDDSPLVINRLLANYARWSGCTEIGPAPSSPGGQSERTRNDVLRRCRGTGCFGRDTRADGVWSFGRPAGGLWDRPDVCAVAFVPHVGNRMAHYSYRDSHHGELRCAQLRNVCRPRTGLAVRNSALRAPTQARHTIVVEKSRSH